MSNKNNNAESIARGLVKTLQHPELMEYLQDAQKYRRLANRITTAIGPITHAETSVIIAVLEDVIGTFKSCGYDPDITALFHANYGLGAEIYSGTAEQCMEMMKKINEQREEDV